MIILADGIYYEFIARHDGLFLLFNEPLTRVLCEVDFDSDSERARINYPKNEDFNYSSSDVYHKYGDPELFGTDHGRELYTELGVWLAATLPPLEC